MCWSGVLGGVIVLLVLIGWSGFVGVVVMFLIMWTNMALAQQNKKLEVKNLDAADRRIGLIGISRSARSKRQRICVRTDSVRADQRYSRL